MAVLCGMPTIMSIRLEALGYLCDCLSGQLGKSCVAYLTKISTIALHSPDRAQNRPGSAQTVSSIVLQISSKSVHFWAEL